jgi:SH3-like domain-containing protein
MREIKLKHDAALYLFAGPVNYRLRFLAVSLLPLLLILGCGRGSKQQEIVYVSAPQTFLRDRVATIYTKTGVVKNGDRLQVLERDRRFARVRAEDGSEGWVEQRNLVNQQVFDGFQKLTQEAQNLLPQATGVTRNDTNLHLTPGRDTEHLYQLNRDSRVSLLKREIAEKPGMAMPAKTTGNQKGSPTKPVLEDWWLIRDSASRCGWVLGRMIDVDIPLEVAQYAEGQRIVAFFMLDQVTDGDRRVPQYLVLLNENKDGMPFDYEQVRVFTWNVKRHRYETAYRERNLNGVLPVTVAQENFEKEGMLPTFVLRIKDVNGATLERKYKLNTPIVRRVFAPGEEKQTPSARQKQRKQ